MPRKERRTGKSACATEVKEGGQRYKKRVKRAQDAGATRDEKRKNKWRDLDMVGDFFQVGYEELHFFVAGGFVWGAQDGGRVDCGHHVGS